MGALGQQTQSGPTSPERHVVMFHPYVADRAIDQVVEVLRSRWIGQGSKVEEFEDRFRDVVGVPYAVAVNCGASALRLALAVAGVGPGDEVITTPMACTATNHPILEQYATPVFADIQYLTGNLDPKDIEHRITERTKVILCTHWGGYPCDIDEIHAIASRHNLTVVEDASDALGATYKGRAVGSLSRFTVFSFQAVQQVTTGEGGMLCVLQEDDYEAARRRRWFGIDRKGRKPNVMGYYDFDIWEPGYGYHVTNIAAAMGLAHLEEFPVILRRRSEIAALYRQELEGVPGVTLFESKPDRTSGHQLFTLHVEHRDDFCRMMRSRGVEVSVVHVRNDQYTVFGGLRLDLPILEKFSATYISIPLHNLLFDEDVQYVIQCIRRGW